MSAMTELDAASYASIERLISCPVDWGYVVRQAAYHEILPLVYYTINKFKKVSIPAEISSQMERRYYAVLSANIRLWKEFCSIQEAFNKAGVGVIPLKGIILGETLYHNIGLRQMSDIDILIEKGSLARMDGIAGEMLKFGYQIELERLPEEYWRKYHCHIKFYKKEMDLAVDMHWAYAPPWPQAIDLSGAWKRSSNQTIDNTQVLTLSPEDTLLSLCAQTCRDIFNLRDLKLKGLCDINELISQYGGVLDWDYILDRMGCWRLKGAFSYLHALTRKCLKTPWPADIAFAPSAAATASGFSGLKTKRLPRIKAAFIMLVLLDSASDRIMLCLLGSCVIFQKIRSFILNIARR